MVSFFREADQGVMPSTLLGDQEWLGRMCQLFEVEYLMPSVTVINEMKSKGTFCHDQSERAIQNCEKEH